MKQLRVFYAAGPGHVIGTFIHWKSGQDEPYEPAVAYSAQYFDICREFNARGYLITACPQRGFLREGLFHLKHRPFRLSRASGIFYHLGQVLNGLRLSVSAICFRSDVAIIAEGSHWFLFSLLRLAGIKVVPSLQSRVFDQSRQNSISQKFITWLNARFFTRACYTVMSMPHELTAQVVELTRGRRYEFVEFIPLYKRQAFEDVKTPCFNRRPFRVLYVGRIEAAKGVFDVLDIAKRFRIEGRCVVEFDICGDGSALNALRSDVAASGLSDRFRCHGHCDRFKIREMYNYSHVVVIPTRTESGEGFNKVAIEAVLCGRPVITSSAWTAWKPFIFEAVMEVIPNDPKSYGDAIIRLCEDKLLYEQMVRACIATQACFYDPTHSWGAALRRVLTAALQGDAPAPYSVPRGNGDGT